MEQNKMSKFCIELEGITMFDAIKAVIEAWYDAQNMDIRINEKAKNNVKETAQWEEELRLKVKRQFGRGWSIYKTDGNKLNPYGKTRLTRIESDCTPRTRESVVIPVEYREENAKLISSHVFEAIDLFNGTGGNLRNCIDTMEKLGTFAKSSAI
jgi:hypothetical protein